MIHWKQFICVILANICLVTISYFVSTDVQVVYSKSLYNQHLKEALYENIKSHNENFTITFRGNTEKIDQQLEHIMNDLQYEDPYAYENMVNWRASYSYTSKKAKLNFYITYLITPDQERFLTNEVKRLAHKIITNQMSDFEKVKGIHDYVLRNAEYSSETNASQYSPYTILTEQKGVCQAYAFLMYRLLQEANVEVRYVKGMAKGSLHAWNLVKLENEWYHLDATWNDTVVDGKVDLGYQYFLLNDQQMKLTHSWIQSAYPTAVAQNEIVLEKLVISGTLDDLYNVEKRLNNLHPMAMPL